MITSHTAAVMEQETKAAYPVLINKIARDVAATLVVLKRTDDLLSKYFSPADKREHWEAIEDRILVAARDKKGVKVRDLARIGGMVKVLVRAASMESMGASEIAEARAGVPRPKRKSVFIPLPEGESEERWDRLAQVLKGKGIGHSLQDGVLNVFLPDAVEEADRLVEELAAEVFCGDSGD